MLPLWSDGSSDPNRGRKRGQPWPPGIAFLHREKQAGEEGAGVRPGLTLQAAKLERILPMGFYRGRHWGAKDGELLLLQASLHLPLPSSRKRLSMPLFWLRAFLLMLSMFVCWWTQTLHSVHKTSLLDMSLKLPYTEASSHFSYRTINIES